MATIVLQAAGAFLGGFLGSAGAAIGSAAGALAGYVVDRALLQSGVTREGPRLTAIQPYTAEEGATLPRLYGAARLSGTLIWATRFQETSQTERQGFKGGPKTTTYAYAANAAFALCEGPIAGVRRIWADGRELDREDFEIRIHNGGEAQPADPLIEAKQGENATPAYRGTAYAVIDNFPLENFGNRLPQLQFEVLRPIGRLHESIRAVALIPGSTEYGLATTPVTREIGPGETEAVNRHVLFGSTDIVASLDELQALCPNLEAVAIVAAWFGDDLRVGSCTIRPKVTHSSGDGFSHPWRVSGLDRGSVPVVSTHQGGSAYGGSPSDFSVIEAIQEVRARGLKVTLYPFVLMDVPADNELPDPYGGTQQAAYPWRGRLTCAPAPGLPGSPDKTAAIRDLVEAFCGEAAPSDFAPAEGGVGFSGEADDFGYRRLVLHYARLAAEAGGVDGFLVGSELRGLTTLRDETNAFPFVAALADLASDARSILGSETKITYGADWSEYFGHHPADGSGDLFFHLDPLWAHGDIDAVGIDNYMPLSDWRDVDYAGGNPDGFDGPYDPGGLKAAIAGGEGYDWYYPSDAARRARDRAEITDGAYGKPWVYRTKDLVNWWSNPHFDRIGGVEQPSPTAWAPESKPIWMTELGCPATDKGPNQPNVFPDPKSSESAAPYFSNGGRSDLAQFRFLQAHFDHWDPDSASFDGAKNPVSSVYGGRMVDPTGIHIWSWDVRPFPAFPLQNEIWSDGGNWLAGHWLNGRLEKVANADLIEAILADHGVDAVATAGVEGTMAGYVAEPSTARRALEPVLDLFGLAAFEDGERLVFTTTGRQAATPSTVEETVIEGDDPAVVRTIAAAHEIPDVAALSYRDPLIGYQAGSARAERPGGDGGRAENVDSGGMLEAGEAEGLAVDWLRRRALDREQTSFAVPAQDRTLDPGVVFRLGTTDGDNLVTAVEEGVARRISARRIARTPPAPQRTHLPSPRLTVESAIGPAFAVFLDLPLGPSDSVAENQLRVAAFAKPWIPQVVFASPDSAGFGLRATIPERATVGELVEAAPGGVEGRVGRHRTIVVRLYGGELASVTRLQMLNGANAAAIRSATGEWEVVQFETAEEIAASIWRLTGLLRGQLGTEDALAAGLAPGATFVLLDGAVVPVGLKMSETGLSLNWRIGPAGKDMSGATFQTLAASGGVRGLTPFSPVHLRAEWLAGDLAISWVRRSRIDADSWLGIDVPLGEESEAYAIDIAGESGPVVRSVETLLPGWTYPAAMIAADFPVLPATIDISVAQLSARVGRGTARTLSYELT